MTALAIERARPTISAPAETPDAAPRSCRDCPVKDNSMCGKLDQDALAELDRMRTARNLRPRQPLAWEGEDDQQLAMVRSGIVQLTASTARGDEQIVGLAFQGGLVGRPFGRGTAFGIAPVGDAQVCTFPRAAFERLARQHPTLGHSMLVHALDELDQARRWMMILSTPRASHKLAAFLLDMADRIGEPGDRPGEVELNMPFSRQQIADLLGLTIETVSRQFSRLRLQGVIRSRNRFDVAICDMPALRSEAES